MKNTTSTEIQEKVKEWIQKNYPNGYEIYPNYNDKLNTNDITDLLESDNPKETLLDMLNERYLYDEYDYLIDNLTADIKDDFMEENITITENTEEEIIEALKDNLTVNVPYDHYLEQKVCCNIEINNGDAEYDYTLHTCYPHYESHYHTNLARKSGLMLLANLQGYSRKKFHTIYNKYKKARGSHKEQKRIALTKKYPFITSCFEEINNLPSEMGALTICVKMTVEELLESKNKDIKIPKDTNSIGLYDAWNGGGSLFEIKLEKDIVIPKEKIKDIWPDNGYRYSIENCYGFEEDFWKEIA